MKNFLIGAALLAIIIVVAISAGHKTPPAVEPEPVQSSTPPLLYPVSPAEPGANSAPPPVGEPTVAVSPPPPPPAPTAKATTAAAPVSERAVAVANLPTVAPAVIRAGRTEMGSRDEGCLYCCSKCNKVFSPTRESLMPQVRIQWSDAIDCPLCNGRACAYFAKVCPSCRQEYAQKANTVRGDDSVLRMFCPRCGMDPVEWIQGIRRARKTSPTDPPRTVLGPYRENYKFLCGKCLANFTPTRESVQQQLQGQKAPVIDCPLCYGRQCATQALCCPKCKHVHMPEGNTRTVAGAVIVVCPHCKAESPLPAEKK